LKVLDRLNCTCPICGTKFHAKPSIIKRGRGKYCSRKCYCVARKRFMMKEGNHQYGQHWMAKENNPNWRGGTSFYRYECYKRNAKKRGVLFNIPIEEFKKYWGKPCSYCGSEILTIGLDRVDSSVGYVEGNIVPCCELCNWMKRELPLTIFLEHIEKIYLVSRKVGDANESS